MLPENNLIMSGTLMRSFRHLQCQNPSIISDSLGRARMVQQFWNGSAEESEEELEEEYS